MSRFSSDTTPRADKSDIDNDICELLYQFGPDRHIDGHEEISAYVQGMVAAEREACAQILSEFLSKWGNDMSEEAADDIRELMADIRARGTK